MLFSSIFINLLEFFRITSFVFDLKYLSQNSINFNMLGVFRNPQDKQFPKLSLDLNLEQHLKEILSPGGHHCIWNCKALCSLSVIIFIVREVKQANDETFLV